MKQISIKVQFFGYTAELTGCSNYNLTVEDGSTVKDAVALLTKEIHALSKLNGSTSFAINTDYVDGNAQLKDGDVLSFIPAVGGG